MVLLHDSFDVHKAKARFSVAQKLSASAVMLTLEFRLFGSHFGFEAI